MSTRAETFTEESEFDFEGVFSDSDYSTAHKKILAKAKRTNFGDKDDVETFQDYFQKNVKKKHRESLLHRVARIQDKNFYDCNGPALVNWVVTKYPQFLQEEGADDDEKWVLHIAIEHTSLAFLDCLLDFPRDDLSLALDQENNSHYNCLHAAISKRLSYTPRLITKCLPKTLTQQAQSNMSSPLHLLMEKSTLASSNPNPSRSAREPTTANLSRPKDAANPLARGGSDPSGHAGSALSRRSTISLSRNGNGPVKHSFDIAEVLEKMISPWERDQINGDNSRSKYITELMTATNNKGESPYQVRRRKYEKPSGKEKELQQRLRTIISENLTEIPHIGKALYGVKASEFELCLDMSDFNRSSHDFTRFIEKLKDSEKTDFKFQETLFYLTLPDFNTFSKMCHDGVRHLFSWLKDEKGVKTIKDLKMPDSATSPMSEELVQEAIIEQFEIEKFDWRKLDISLDILTGSKHSDKLKDITLYSSCNWGVLYHWASDDGLVKLGGQAGLRKVKIKIVELNPSNDQKAKTRHQTRSTDFKKKLEDEFTKKGVRFKPEIIPNAKWDFPILQVPDDDQTLVPQLKILQHLVESHRYLWSLDDACRKEEWTDESQRFKDHPVKIAIIDNGADKIRSTLKKNIEKGVSFVTADLEGDNRILPWWMVADPHGTQMASLIKTVNPFCRLYIARVGKGRKDILPERAAQAVEWAIEQKVDIISISWVTKTDEKLLRDAITKAAGSRTDSPILVFSSTADEGVDPGKIFPAAYPETFTVAATDRYGHMRPASQEGVDILVPGEDISADGPVYMEKFTSGTVSGSSVATALAAGIASLALLMLRVFNEDGPALKEFLRKEQMMGVFAKMGSGRHGIQLSQVFEGRDPKKLGEKWKATSGNFPEPRKSSVS